MEFSNVGIRNQEGATFGDLPLDLHLHIFSFTDLGDIIALRKTCKRFHSITSQRIIWVDLLRRVCSDNSVFKPTFPIDEMSTIDLEQAVFAPARWLNQVMKNNYDAIRSSRRVRTITSSRNASFQGVYLVPGGRFLITLSEVDMCVWDLGYSSSTILSSAPIASAPHAFKDVFSVVPTADELGLRIFAITYNETNGWADEGSRRGEFRVFEIYPLSNKPTLSSIASLIENYSEDALFSLCGDLLVYQDANYVKIWNFITDMGVTFYVGDDPFEQICVTADSIALFRAAAVVSIWNIPPLIPGGHREKPGGQFVEPNPELSEEFNLNIDFFEEGEEPRMEFERPSQWYPHHPITFDVIYWYEKLCTISRYEVVLPAGRVKPQHKFILPAEWVAMVSSFEPSRICNGNLIIMYWSSYQSVMAASVPLEPQKFWKSENITLLYDEIAPDNCDVTLCPVAGRLCHISPEQDSIIIFDYLTPPSS